VVIFFLHVYNTTDNYADRNRPLTLIAIKVRWFFSSLYISDSHLHKKSFNTTDILLQQLQCFNFQYSFIHWLFIHTKQHRVHTVIQSNTVYDLDRPTLVLILRILLY